MKYLSRVVWSEGMYLGPHHFQVQSRYFEDSTRFAVSSLWFESWGLLGCAMDGEALRNGTVSMVHGRGVFPDGLLFNSPEADPLPEPRQIAEAFPPTRDTLTVLLSVPERKQDGMNCSLPETDARKDTRFFAETALLHDETTGRDEKPVHMGRKNIRFLLDIEPADGFVTLPVARVARDGTGHFIYDPKFVPPCLKISASDRLMTMLRRLVEVLEEKSTALARGKQSGGKSWAEYSTRDIANFWMLHAVNSAMAPLRHLYLTKRGHPEEMFSEMLRLGGALCTFALESHPRTLPLYDHLKLDDRFGALDEHIRMHLETIVPTNCIPIKLERTANYFFEGKVADQRLLSHSRWIFALSSPIGDAEMITTTPRLVKVCSKLFAPELVKRALPGMALTHLPVPPSAVSARADTQYFLVSKAGPCWDHIVQTRDVGVYIPGELPDPKPELLVILES